MQIKCSRRSFLGGIGALAATAVLSKSAFSALRPTSFGQMLTPPTDLAHFNTKIAAPASELRFGFTSMTWGGAERQAIDDISALGYPGIHMRANAVTDFQPSGLRDLLHEKKLTFVALSSGDLNIDPTVEKDEIAKHVVNAKFVHDAGGLYIQVMDRLAKERPRVVTPAECKRLGQLLTEIGKRSADLGVTLGYHNHLNTISERPENLERVLDAADARYVKLLLDTAHYLAGGGDPAKAVVDHREHLALLHAKDVVDAPMGTEKNQKYPFKFVELGQGRVDLPAFFAAVKKIKYRGWVVVELDRVPVNGRTPKESAAMCKSYIEEKLRMAL